jgi:hypothetical protein
MTLTRFEISDLMRCPAVDTEGFRCSRAPSHDGPHRWGRCQQEDPDGHRCILPPGHPGDHALAWFDRPTVAGTTHEVRYGGTEKAASARADADARVYIAHNWVPASRSFRAGLPWRWPRVAAALAGVTEPRGELTVAYEYRPFGAGPAVEFGGT